MNRNEIKSRLINIIKEIKKFYSTIDNSLTIDEKNINLVNKNICTISLRDNTIFYFKFMDAVNQYRERIKKAFATSEFFLDYKQQDENDNRTISFGNLTIESRIKNINSIFSKIYQYNHKKNEKGKVPITKCLNDLLGFRVIVPMLRFKNLDSIIKEILKEEAWKYKFINASKAEYKAMHLYIGEDNYSFRWEIQFWLKKYDSSNRLSHSKYKQAYTKWEEEYIPKQLYQIC